MEEHKEKLYRLLIDELESLNLGHTYNIPRIKLMREICHILVYYTYVDLDNYDIMKIVNYYD